MTADDHTDGRIRIEEDALGNVEVPADHLWGAQTERSRQNFRIGVDRYRWGRPVIRALRILKKCAALANSELGQLPGEKVDLIVRAAQEIIDGSSCTMSSRRFKCWPRVRARSTTVAPPASPRTNGGFASASTAH